MILSNLIKELQAIQTDYEAGQYGDQEKIEVITAKDAEGNGFNTLDAVFVTRYDGEETYLVRLTDKLRMIGYTEEDCNEDAPIVVCMWQIKMRKSEIRSRQGLFLLGISLGLFLGHFLGFVVVGWVAIALGLCFIIGAGLLDAVSDDLRTKEKREDFFTEQGYRTTAKRVLGDNVVNLLEETKEAIKASGHTQTDIVFIGSEKSGHRCTWAQFENLANRNYACGFGEAEVAVDLIVVFSDGAKMWRGEYDGSEWWEYSSPFVSPSVSRRISNLFAKVGWDSLAKLNG